MYNYSCYENGKKELSPSLFERALVQNKEDKDAWIHSTEWKSESELESDSDWLQSFYSQCFKLFPLLALNLLFYVLNDT